MAKDKDDELRGDKEPMRVYLPSTLLKELKHEAIDADLSLSAYVEKILRARDQIDVDLRKTEHGE